MLGRSYSITKHAYKLAINEEWALSLHGPFPMKCGYGNMIYAMRCFFTRAASFLCRLRAHGRYPRWSGRRDRKRNWSMRRVSVFWWVRLGRVDLICIEWIAQSAVSGSYQIILLLGLLVF